MRDKTFFIAKGLKIILTQVISSGFTIHNEITEGKPLPSSVIPRLTRDLRLTKVGFWAGR